MTEHTPHISPSAQEAYDAVRKSLVDSRDGYEECGICGMELSRGHRMDCAFPDALDSLNSLYEQLETLRGTVLGYRSTIGRLRDEALALNVSDEEFRELFLEAYPPPMRPVEEVITEVYGSNPASRSSE